MIGALSFLNNLNTYYSAWILFISYKHGIKIAFLGWDTHLGVLKIAID